MYQPRRIIVLSLTLALSIAFGSVESAPLNKKSFVAKGGEMGVVLLDVNWGRQWNCAGNENPHLIELRFENVSREFDDNDKYAKIALKTPSRLFVNPEFHNYGFLLRPGTYAFTEWSIKYATSVSNIGYLKAGRNELVDGNEYPGGTFEVAAGEVVYIGNFFLDCYYSPIPWRYYSEGEKNFQSHSDQYKSIFKFLRDKEITYRLLDTDSYGEPYELPEN